MLQGLLFSTVGISWALSATVKGTIHSWCDFFSFFYAKKVKEKLESSFFYFIFLNLEGEEHINLACPSKDCKFSFLFTLWLAPNMCIDVFPYTLASFIVWFRCNLGGSGFLREVSFCFLIFC